MLSAAHDILGENNSTQGGQVCFKWPSLFGQNLSLSSEKYFMSECNMFHHEKILNFVSSNSHVIFFVNMTFVAIFWWFQPLSEDFRFLLKLVQRPANIYEHFSNILNHFSKDHWREPKIFEAEVLKKIRRKCYQKLYLNVGGYHILSCILQQFHMNGVSIQIFGKRLHMKLYPVLH